MASRRSLRERRWLRYVGIALLIVVTLAVAGSFFIDEPLRRVVVRQMVRQMNRQLKGYSAEIRQLSFHPVGLSLTLYDLTFLQEAHPEPPVFHAPQLDASVQWKALLRGRLVANFALKEPALYVNLQQLRAEAADPTPVKDHGWQEPFEAIYPLKINELRVTDRRVTYIDEGPFAPLEVTQINLTAQNIRNIRSQDRTYPSDLQLDAVAFQHGRVTLNGHADFLAVPVPGVHGDVKLEGIALDYFKPVLNRGSVAIEGGTLSAAGAFEYGPTVRIADLKEATISGMRSSTSRLRRRLSLGFPRRPLARPCRRRRRPTTRRTSCSARDASSWSTVASASSTRAPRLTTGPSSTSRGSSSRTSPTSAPRGR
jgi:hypothetical protein